MKKLVASALVILAVGIVPMFASAHGNEADAQVDLPDGSATFYVDVETGGLWQESNSDAGLQTAAHNHTDADGNPVSIAADTRIA